jgi:hypothetical protein
MRARVVLGLAGVANNSVGDLSIRDNGIVFSRREGPSVQIPLSAIQGAFLSEEDKQVGGTPMVLGRAAIPFGGDLLKNERERRLYDFQIAPERLGRVFMVSGKVPAVRLALLRAGFERMVADPAFRSDAQRLKLLVAPMPGEEVAGHIAEIYATPPDIVARAKAIIGN